MLLDKTGTLTYGKPHVALIDPADGYQADELLQIAATGGRISEHPLALAVVAAAEEKQQEGNVLLPAMSSGAGTRVLVARDGQFAGSIHIANQVRDGASEAIRELLTMGLELELLTGGTEASASAVAESIGIRQVGSGLLPELLRDLSCRRPGNSLGGCRDD